MTIDKAQVSARFKAITEGAKGRPSVRVSGANFNISETIFKILVEANSQSLGPGLINAHRVLANELSAQLKELDGLRAALGEDDTLLGEVADRIRLTRTARINVVSDQSEIVYAYRAKPSGLKISYAISSPIA